MVTLSEEQKNILDFVSNSPENLTISGVAGCGKSTTLRLIAKTLKEKNPDLRILYLAFNNEICSDIEEKLSGLADVLTFHKWGVRSIPWKKRINQYKYRNYVQSYINSQLELTSKSPFGGIPASKIVSVIDILRLWFVSVDCDSVLAAMEHWNIDKNEEWYNDHLESFTAFVKQTIYWGIDQKNRYNIDFVDMLCFPVIFRREINLLDYDVYLIDEAQDLSVLMHRMICSKLNSARIISVGDSFQAINSFAGASASSFDDLKIMTQAKELSLTTCYRCPDEVLNLARKYVPHIKGTGKKGLVENKTISGMIESVQPNQMILCRKNQPLVMVAIKLLLKGKKIIIKGRDFGDYLVSFVNKIKNKNVSYSSFLEELETMIQELIAATKNESRIELLTDVQLCLVTLYENSLCDDYSELSGLIKSLFSDNIPTNSIILSTYHRSKGLENNNVWLLLRDPLPAAQEKPDNLDQELNLAYVAITRSLQNLYLVSKS